MFSVRGRNVYGLTIERGCGQLPAVGQLHGEIATMVAKTATDAEIRTLAGVLQAGTAAEQEGAVQAIGSTAIDRTYANP